MDNNFPNSVESCMYYEKGNMVLIQKQLSRGDSITDRKATWAHPVLRTITT